MSVWMILIVPRAVSAKSLIDCRYPEADGSTNAAAYRAKDRLPFAVNDFQHFSVTVAEPTMRSTADYHKGVVRTSSPVNHNFLIGCLVGTQS